MDSEMDDPLSGGPGPLTVSKASLKEYPRAVQELVNGTVSKAESPGDPAVSDPNLSTQPSEDTTDSIREPESPVRDGDLTEGSAKQTTPIKMRIRRSNSQGQETVTTTVTVGDETETTEKSVTIPISDSSDSSAIDKKPKPKKQKVELPMDPPPKWLVGDFVWSKVPGHPWWPCMISFDPLEGIYVKAASKTARQYHVQFFGPTPERGWVRETATVEFQGLEAFRKLAQDPKDVKKFALDVKGKRKEAWDIALYECSQSLHLSRAERKQLLTFNYEPPKVKATPGGENANKTPTQKRKSKTGTTPTSRKRKSTNAQPEEGTRGVTQMLEIMKKIEPQNSQPKQTKTRKSWDPVKVDKSGKTDFDVYCEKNEAKEKDEHPDCTPDKIREILQRHWICLSEKEKKEYQAKINPDGSPKKPRQRKPSKKLLEASEAESLEKETTVAATSVVTPATSVTQAKKKRGRPKNLGKSDATPNDATGDDIEKPKKQVRKRKQPDYTEISEKQPVKKARKESTPTDNMAQPVYESRISSDDDSGELELLRLSNSAPAKRANVCQICELNGELISCTGPCLGSFHLHCIGLSITPSDAFKCDECTTGIHTCFSCKKSDGDTKKCNVPMCGKFYHMECVQKYKLTRTMDKGFYCPLHSCASCAACDPSNPKAKALRGKLFRCARCPTAYHTGDFCIAAGSIVLAGYNIVCSNHFQPVKNHKHHAHVNVSWCFICNKGGTLICCDSCPAAFHATCLGIDFPEGRWFCQDCANGKKPLYGDIVWVKLGNYRWWPAQICHPKNVPLNIQDKIHQVGEFPVKFFGSNDYYWTHQARLFNFHEDDKGSKESTSSKGLAKVFQRAIQEATEAFQNWKRTIQQREVLEKDKTDKKPAPFKFVKSNVPVGSVTICKADLSTIPRCDCKPEMEHPCSSKVDCINRMLLYECNPSICPAGDKCENQRFQKREYPLMEPYKTKNSSGWGLQCLEDIKKGRFVSEYVGELIDEEECKRRIKKSHDDNVTNFYLLTIEKNRIIDAGPKGNNSRFMNHSCQPNCETQKWHINGDIRVGLFAKCDIPSGSDLTFNYNLDCLGNDKTPCHCGAANCSGFIGVRPKPQTAGDRKDGIKKRKKKKKIQRLHDDDCFRCGEGGELVMCDRNKCPKAYHLQCLGLEKLPFGAWICPWHLCDECGKNSTQLCSECPNSFCTAHYESHILTMPGGRKLCEEHKELIELLQNSPEGDSKPPPADTMSESESLVSTSDATSDGSSQVMAMSPVSSPHHEQNNNSSDDKKKPKPRAKAGKVKEKDVKQQQQQQPGLKGPKTSKAAAKKKKDINKPSKKTTKSEKLSKSKVSGSSTPLSDEDGFGALIMDI